MSSLTVAFALMPKSHNPMLERARFTAHDRMKQDQKRANERTTFRDSILSAMKMPFFKEFTYAEVASYLKQESAKAA